MSGLRGNCARCGSHRWLDEATERCAKCSPYAETHVRIERAMIRYHAFIVVFIAAGFAFGLGIVVGRFIG